MEEKTEKKEDKPIDLARKKRGRKRKWASNADRQKAYRERRGK